MSLPLSIGDDDLAATADELVSVPEMFATGSARRMDVGFLGAAQIDRHGNINTTVIGPYDAPEGAAAGRGGAPEIAAAVRKVIVMLRHSPRAFVERLDFVTSLGRGGGAFTVITDLGVLEPGADGELELVALHTGVELDQVLEATGWPLRVREPLAVTEPPTERELEELRALRDRR